MTPEQNVLTDGSNARFRRNSWCLRNNWSNYSWLVLMKNNEPKLIEKEKLLLKINGRFAMIGFIALVGAYLTTGQIIPGFI